MLNLDNIVDFPGKKVDTLVKIAQEKRVGLQEMGLYVNEIVREDIFKILDHYCTVVFYPLPEEEENDGFHITMPVDYKEDKQEHFVFLNTAKPLEKQVFAAAHELGHIWVPLEEFWDNELERELPRSQDTSEAVMNRFAAELLMPHRLFQQSADEQLRKFITEGHRIYVDDAFRVVASLMDEFCVPAQAVICRFYETGLLKKAVCKQLLSGPIGVIGELGYPVFFESMVRECVKEGGYTKLLCSTGKRGIQDFPEVLNAAEREGVFPPQKVDSLREMLQIPKMIEQRELIDVGEVK